MFKYGDTVITKNGKVGIITQALSDNEYFVSFESYGMTMSENDIKEWYGCW